jgi:hypothetical protein
MVQAIFSVISTELMRVPVESCPFDWLSKVCGGVCIGLNSLGCHVDTVQVAVAPATHLLTDNFCDYLPL